MEAHLVQTPAGRVGMHAAQNEESAAAYASVPLDKQFLHLVAMVARRPQLHWESTRVFTRSPRGKTLDAMQCSQPQQSKAAERSKEV